MAQLLLALFFVSHLQAQEAPSTANLNQQVGLLKELKVDQNFDENFRPLSLEIERLLDLKRAECTEATGQKSDKQLCFRQLVSVHKEYIKRSFDLKLDYLKLLHDKQITALEEARKKTLQEIERQF
jgi:hypothetical protein